VLIKNPDTVPSNVLREMGKKYKNNEHCYNECKTCKTVYLFFSQKYFSKKKIPNSVVLSIEKINPVEFKKKKIKITPFKEADDDHSQIKIEKHNELKIANR